MARSVVAKGKRQVLIDYDDPRDRHALISQGFDSTQRTLALIMSGIKYFT